MNYNTAFKVLGVNPPIEKEELKKQYRALVKLHHPDVGGEKSKFILVQEAYDLLNDNLTSVNNQNNQSRGSYSGAYYRTATTEEFNDFFNNFVGKPKAAEQRWEEIKKEEAELKAKRRAEYYQNEELRYRPSERKTPKTQKGFVKVWRELHRLLLSELKKSTPGKEIGEMLERKLDIFTENVCPIKNEWFLGALEGQFYREKGDRQMKRYFNIMLYIAPDANIRHQWAQKYFKLEFGHYFSEK